MATDAELRDSAWTELTLTTDSYPAWKRKGFPTGTHWSNAKKYLDQIGNGTNPSVFGTLGTSTAKATSEVSAGLNAAEIDVGWDQYETADGTYNASYASNINSQVQAFRAAGMKVVLGLALHYPPAWALAYTDGKFKNQFGVTSNIVNIVFNRALRTKVAALISRINSDIGLNNFYAIRITSGGDAECLLPDGNADGAHSNSYWAYDTNAQNGGTNLPSTLSACPYPGWKPGDLVWNGNAFTTAQTTAWYTWYQGALIDCCNFFIQQYLSHGYSGLFYLLTPGQGNTPSQYTNSLANHLDGTQDFAGTLMRGAAWHKFYELFPYRTNVVAYCSSAMDNSGSPADNLTQAGDQNIAVTDPQCASWSSARWIAYLGNKYGMANAGENPGGGATYGLLMMQKLGQQMIAANYESMWWARDSNLYDGISGVTVSNYSTVAANVRAALGR